jgi:hypothetical protein
MTILPTLVNPVPLPAPIISGTGIQSYTDPMGDVWVAANGVNAGAWKRARDVLNTRVYRAAAWSISGSGFTAVFDTAQNDPYGLHNLSNGQFIVPVPGWYLLSTHQQGGAAPSAGNTYLSQAFLRNGTAIMTGNQSTYTGTGGNWPSLSSTHGYLLSQGDAVTVQVGGNITMTLATGTGGAWFDVHYLGTG